jgi:hypothetical protein
MQSAVGSGQSAVGSRQWAVGGRQPAARLFCAAAVIALLAGLVLPSLAMAQEIGTVAALEGTVEIGRAGVFSPAALGSTVSIGDEIRTSRPGRVRVVFRDDSVLNIGEDSNLRLDEQVFDPDRGVFRTLIHLLKGKVRAIVGDYYQRPRGVFEIETATAVSGVRGTEFVIAYDPVAEVTEVVGVTEQVAVNSVRDRVGHRVFVSTQQLTVVRKGEYPTPPAKISDQLFRQYIEDLDFIGRGRAESAALASSTLKGTGVPAPETAAQVAVGIGIAGAPGIGNRWTNHVVSPLPAGAPSIPQPGWEIEPDRSDSFGGPINGTGGLGIRF